MGNVRDDSPQTSYQGDFIIAIVDEDPTNPPNLETWQLLAILSQVQNTLSQV